jgi:thymidylate synthase
LEAINQVLIHGDSIKTEYDKPDDPPSRDATVLIEITDPLSDPIRTRNGKILKIKSIHGNTYEIYGHISDVNLTESIRGGYNEEILEGTNNDLIMKSKTSFPYTYHDRIFNYKALGKEDANNKMYFNKVNDIWVYDSTFPSLNQLKPIIKKLKQSPYSRRCQAITWRPYSDPFRDDPPCLQRLWFRVIDGKLTLQTSWRSRDLFKAWQSNVNGMIHIQKMVADELGVEMGPYVDFSNSLHLYGFYMKEIIDTLERINKR